MLRFYVPARLFCGLLDSTESLDRTSIEDFRNRFGEKGVQEITQEMLEIATRGGAAVLGRDDLGRLAVGMAADFVAWQLDALDYAGAQHDPLAALVFCAPRRVDLAVINGRVRVWKGEIVGFDLERTIAHHNELSRRLVTGA